MLHRPLACLYVLHFVHEQPKHQMDAGYKTLGSLHLLVCKCVINSKYICSHSARFTLRNFWMRWVVRWLYTSHYTICSLVNRLQAKAFVADLEKKQSVFNWIDIGSLKWKEIQIERRAVWTWTKELKLKQTVSWCQSYIIGILKIKLTLIISIIIKE